MKNEFIIGIDPGLSGAICIISPKEILIYDMPTISGIVGKKKKKNYNIQEIVKIFKNNLSKKHENICIIEDVHCSVGNGAVSMFNFGRGKGILEGISSALDMKTILVSPQLWKKFFPELVTENIVKLKDEQKSLRLKNKEISRRQEDIKSKNKKIKDIAIKKKNKQVIQKLKIEHKNNKNLTEKIGRQVKSIAKDNARDLASKLYPKLKDKFTRKKDDGRAESLLIAHYALDFVKKGN